MKKLLNILTSVTLIGSAATSVAACGGGGGKKDPDLSTMQKEMLNGAEFISRLIVAGRHENLNYNVNEILSIFLTPLPTAMNMPTFYKYENSTINIANKISKFKNNLAPSLNYYNGDNYAGMFASYLMGMYEDDFYNNMINGGDENANYFNDTFSINGNQGYNKKSNNAMGYAAGLGKDINLSKNEERRELAWAIQDTGALSNYLLSLGFDGANPTDTNGTSSPVSNADEHKKGGTNGSGYAWYNSILMSGRAKKSKDFSGKLQSLENNKLKDLGYNKANDDNKSMINGKEFNSTGGLITKIAGEQNISGFISLFGSMLENISDTKNGALILSEFMNIIFPLIRIKSSGLFGASDPQSISQAVGFSLITNVWDAIKKIDSNIIKDENILESIKNLDKSPDSVWFIPGTTAKPENVKISVLYKDANKDNEEIGGQNGTNAKNIIKIIDLIVELYNNEENKKEFIEKLFISKNSPFYSSYKTIINYIGPENWEKSMLGEDNDGAINLLKFAKGAYLMMTNRDVIEKFERLIEEFKGENTFRDLTSLQKNKFLELIGWSEKGYEDKSLGKLIYNSFTNSEVTGQKDFSDFFSGFKDYVTNAMAEVHEPVLQYLVDDKYWRVNNFKINTTSNTQRAGKMEFTLDYNGIGDSTSNASKQTKKVVVEEKFNPYQTISKHQEQNWTSELKSKLDEDKIANSGKILGVEQGAIKKEDIANYDGLGNYQDYKTVKNSYKIVWENISNNPESPYWVITSLKSFNANGEEFYNIY
ncbi:lipoprotein [Spiroplasma endosymbiont of Cantharis nigra]|uniref:lipoprotein n=1 Tax=Spiroplasma endosymbiont of Cantharis nigra TaxID=3066278 RepID=UPI0030D3BC40